MNKASANKEAREILTMFFFLYAFRDKQNLSKKKRMSRGLYFQAPVFFYPRRKREREGERESERERARERESERECERESERE